MRKNPAISALAGLMLAIAFALSSNPIRVSAHAFLLRTDPADGLVLVDPPQRMRFWFSEPLEMEFTTITLWDGNNNAWELQPYADPEDPSLVGVEFPQLPPGAYRVAWRTVSDEDLHVISGFVVFGIQQSVRREAGRQTQGATPFAEITFRWINLLSFASVIGTLIVIVFLLPSVRKRVNAEQIAILSSLQDKMVISAIWFSIIAFVAGAFMIWQKYNSIGAISIQDFITIDHVRREFASAVCLIIVMLINLSWPRVDSMTLKIQAMARNILLFSFAALWIVFQSMNSHASAFHEFSAVRLIVYALHLLGAALWIGGQAALIFLVAPRLRRSRLEQVALARAIYMQFGYIATLGVAILAVSGIYSTGQQVASLDALLLTPYGQALIFKSVFVILTGLIGFWHASLFHPRLARLLFKFISYRTAWMIFGRANPVLTLRMQLLGGAAIFLLAGFLGSTPPARGPDFVVTAENLQPASISSMADDLLVNFSIKPNQPGQNFISIGVFNTRRPVPAPIEQIVVKLISPDKRAEIQLNAVLSEKDGNFQTSTGEIDLSGDWNVSVMVHRTGLSDAVLDLPWRVASTAIVTPRPTLISNRPLAPLLTTASLILSIGFVGLWLAFIFKPNLFYSMGNKIASPQEMYQ